MDSPLIQTVQGDVSQMRMLRRAVIKRFLEADAFQDPTLRRELAPDSEGPASRPGRRGQPAPTGPIVLVFDDLHHAHDDSLDLLGYLIDGIEAPLNEQAEAYLVGLGDTANPALRWQPVEPRLTLPAALLAQLAVDHAGEPLWVRQAGSFAQSEPLFLMVL